MKILGIEVNNNAQTVTIDDGIISMFNCSRFNVALELPNHLEQSITTVVGWGRYTHLVRFEDVAYGVLVEAQ